jgi:hypothetical protein
MSYSISELFIFPDYIYGRTTATENDIHVKYHHIGNVSGDITATGRVTGSQSKAVGDIDTSSSTNSILYFSSRNYELFRGGETITHTNGATATVFYNSIVESPPLTVGQLPEVPFTISTKSTQGTFSVNGGTSTYSADVYPNDIVVLNLTFWDVNSPVTMELGYSYGAQWQTVYIDVFNALIANGEFTSTYQMSSFPLDMGNNGDSVHVSATPENSYDQEALVRNDAVVPFGVSIQYQGIVEKEVIIFDVKNSGQDIYIIETYDDQRRSEEDFTLPGIYDQQQPAYWQYNTTYYDQQRPAYWQYNTTYYDQQRNAEWQVKVRQVYEAFVGGHRDFGIFKDTKIYDQQRSAEWQYNTTTVDVST